MTRKHDYRPRCRACDRRLKVGEGLRIRDNWRGSEFVVCRPTMAQEMMSMYLCFREEVFGGEQHAIIGVL